MEGSKESSPKPRQKIGKRELKSVTVVTSRLLGVAHGLELLATHQSFTWAALLGLASVENGLAKSAKEFLSQQPVVGLTLIWIDNFLAWSTDADVARMLSQTWSDMTKRWGLVWGEEKMWHPKHLEERSAELNPDVGTSLSIQFALKVKRGRDDPDQHLIWRLKPKTAARVSEFAHRTEWNCRGLAGVIGSAVWQCYISCKPFSAIQSILELSSRVGRHTRTNGWQATYGLTTEEKVTVDTALARIAANPWWGSHTPQDWTQIRIVASDATLERGAWVYYTASDCRADWKHWSWEECKEVSKGESIFLLELRTAIRAIKANAPTNGILVLVIDNTAAAAVLRSMYSSTRIGRELLDDLHYFLSQRNAFLVVAGIAGVDNDADSPTRGIARSPSWCKKRLAATWATGVRAFHGSERLKQPYGVRPRPSRR
jgi:hypothetical protein